jgi:predicted HicB family RNase H-like nuclease
MKKEKLVKEGTDKPSAKVETAVMTKATIQKKKNGATVAKVAAGASPKVSIAKEPKEKVKKQGKNKSEEKDQKSSKEDKVTKFLVSMKKSLRKSVKKEAAETGMSMNKFIVSAVEQKLLNDAVKE